MFTVMLTINMLILVYVVVNVVLVNVVLVNVVLVNIALVNAIEANVVCSGELVLVDAKNARVIILLGVVRLNFVLATDVCYTEFSFS